MFSNKLNRFVAVSVTTLFLGATSLYAAEAPPPVVIVDTDLDGVADEADECLPSDLSPTVLINGVNTGIQNTPANAIGCTLSDLMTEMIELCLDDAKNHGQFVRCVSYETNILKRARTISGKQKGKIQSIVAKMH